MHARCLIAAILAALTFTLSAAENREALVRNDRARFAGSDTWFYNDLPRAFAEARATAKPLLVVLRCVPCVACKEFDEQVARLDPSVKDLMNQFVCVRLVHANGLDLSLFQFDFDLSFAAFFFNADKTLYGRFGTRSHQENAAQDISMDGFRQALQAALKLHRAYPANRDALIGKQAPPSSVAAPEQFPALRGKYAPTINYSGNVVASCIHCHHVRDAERKLLRSTLEPFSDDVLFPFPMPSVIGLELDPLENATVRDVAPNSPAARAGFQSGDRILSMEGQPLLSIADVQWVLHRASNSGGILTANVQRSAVSHTLEIELGPAWKQNSDISWRVSSWELRRIVLGGLVLEEITEPKRRALQLGPDQLALVVKHVGQYGDHAAAKRAGFQKDDILLQFGDFSQNMTESRLLAAAVNRYQKGASLAVTLLRGTEKLSLTLPVQ